MAGKCCRAYCLSMFEGAPEPGWRWVARHTTTGEAILVCPEHVEELAESDMVWLLKLVSHKEHDFRREAMTERPRKK